jgi:hypothetical protein
VLERSAHVGRFEKFLGGDATAVQARAADLVALNEGDVETGRGSVEGGGVSTGTSSDNHYIELLDIVSHGVSLQRV